MSIIFKKDQVIENVDFLIENKFKTIMKEALEMLSLTRDLQQQVQNNSKNETSGSSISSARRGGNVNER